MSDIGKTIEFVISGHSYDSYLFSGTVISVTSVGYMVKLDPEYEMEHYGYHGALMHHPEKKRGIDSVRFTRKVKHVLFENVYNIAERGEALGKKLDIVD